jgi:hypothetical protein
MHIMYLPITGYASLEEMEAEVCRLLRCSHGKCPAIHTEAFVQFRANLLRGLDNTPGVYLPEGLVLQTAGAGVNFSWLYGYVEST